MADVPTTAPAFAYEAQSAEGQTYRGTLDAAELSAAADQLRSLNLRVIRLEPQRPEPQRRAALSGDDLRHVNRHLAELTAGGMPLERGLRLIAEELPRRQANAVRAIAADLEAGAPIGDALAGRAGAFPPAYAGLLAAGVAANNLPAVLADLGRHVELMHRLRSAVWRAAAYPMAVAVALLLVLAFIWGVVMPQFAPLHAGPLNQWVSYSRTASSSSSSWAQGPDLAWVPLAARAVSYAVMAALAVAIAVVGMVVFGRRAWTGSVGRWVPVIGRVVRYNEVARWCDGLHLGVSAGMPLPDALALAGRAAGSPGAEADTAQLARDVAAGRPLDPLERLHVLPPTVPAALAMGIDRHDLPATTATLARLYREQAEARLAAVPAVLSPVLLAATALCVGLSLAAALLPLVVFVRSMVTR